MKLGLFLFDPTSALIGAAITISIGIVGSLVLKKVMERELKKALGSLDDQLSAFCR